MKIIEFFGLPYAGKSYFSDFCSKFFTKKKRFMTISLFFNYLKKTKINFSIIFL